MGAPSLLSCDSSDSSPPAILHKSSPCPPCLRSVARAVRLPVCPVLPSRPGPGKRRLPSQIQPWAYKPRTGYIRFRRVGKTQNKIIFHNVRKGHEIQAPASIHRVRGGKGRLGTAWFRWLSCRTGSVESLWPRRHSLSGDCVSPRPCAESVRQPRSAALPEGGFVLCRLLRSSLSQSRREGSDRSGADLRVEEIT